jgi:4-amino-4-deoxy-L-arabinose transferase-like glycosyltransferase
VYATVAENILRNGCVSLSLPALQQCVPHWGGNQLPGYPAFLAAVWSVSHTTTAVLLVQSILVSAATTWFAYCAAPLIGRRLAIVLGLVVGLSPLTLAWSRFVLTDALSVACALCLLAEVFRYFQDGRVRVVPIGLFLGAAIFLRYDNAILVVPLSILLWRQRTALLLCVAIALLPAAGWWVRSMEAGLASAGRGDARRRPGAAGIHPVGKRLDDRSV